MDVSGFLGLVLDFVGFGLRFGVEVNEYFVADFGMRFDVQFDVRFDVRFDVVGGLIGSDGLICSIGSIVRQFPYSPLDPSFQMGDWSGRYSGYQTRWWNVLWAGDRCLRCSRHFRVIDFV